MAEFRSRRQWRFGMQDNTCSLESVRLATLMASLDRTGVQVTSDVFVASYANVMLMFTGVRDFGGIVNEPRSHQDFSKGIRKLAREKSIPVLPVATSLDVSAA